MDLYHITKNCGPNPSGIGNNIYAAKVEWFDTLEVPQNVQAAVGAEDLLTITGDHVFKLNKGFLKIGITDETGQLECIPEGEKDGKSFAHTARGFIPGNVKKNLAMHGLMQTCDWIFLVEEIGENGDVVVRQVGNAFRPAYAVDENGYNSGQANADRRGTQLTIKSTGQPYHAPFYEGQIVEYPMTP